jgi:nucleoside-diphosphate-sugar epimerase
MTRRILVIGAGFISSNLIRNLLERTQYVVVSLDVIEPSPQR